MIIKPYTKVNLLQDKTGWVTSIENNALRVILSKLKIEILSKKISVLQICYLPDKYIAIKRGVYFSLLGNKLAFDYYHGDPSISPNFSPLLASLIKKRRYFQRIRVSHTGIETLLKNAGFEKEVFRIPIGLELKLFPIQTSQSKTEARKKLEIPLTAVVVGSFQKDGNGWGEGKEPKLIKGPDIFLKTLEILQSQISELFVLLTGPARGYVKTGLEKLKIPYKHIYLRDYREIGKYYQTLDVYLVTSREEGGPKAILESMASGIPLISTRVGQAQDLVKHGRNGWLTEVEDSEGLAHHTLLALEGSSSMEELKNNARHIAEINSYDSQLNLWQEFFTPLLNNGNNLFENQK